MNEAAILPASSCRYVQKQTIISVIVSMAFSAAFFLLIFRNAGPVEIWAPDFLAYDFLPQSAFASLMAALVPALQTRSAILLGEMSGNTPTISSVVRRAFLFALFGLGLAGIVIAVLKLSGVTVCAWSTAFALKVAYGGLLGVIITPCAVRTIFESDQR